MADTLAQVRYETLNARQQENENFHKIAAVLADYGFNSLRLTDDWQGADFIACHIDGQTMLRVQLKGRLTIGREYQGKAIRIAFRDGDDTSLSPHDALLATLAAPGRNPKQARAARHWQQKLARAAAVGQRLAGPLSPDPRPFFFVKISKSRPRHPR